MRPGAISRSRPSSADQRAAGRADLRGTAKSSRAGRSGAGREDDALRRLSRRGQVLGARRRLRRANRNGRRAERARGKCQPACKPGFVWPEDRSPDVTAIPLGRALLRASSNQPGRPGPETGPCPLARAASSLFGFAPGGACRAVPVAGSAVRSYRTFSPLPAAKAEALGRRRFDLCGAFPGVAPAGRYPAPCFRGARTFLPRERERPSGRLAWGDMRAGAACVKRSRARNARTLSCGR